MLDDMADIGCGLTLIQPGPHEADGGPMLFGQLNALAGGESLGDSLAPVGRIHQVPFRVQAQRFRHGSFLLLRRDGGVGSIMFG